MFVGFSVFRESAKCSFKHNSFKHKVIVSNREFDDFKN